MFEQFSNSGKNDPRWIGLRVLAVGAAGLLVSLGFCGVGATIHSSNGVARLTFIGFWLFVASTLLMLLAVVVTIIEALVSSGRNFLDRLRGRDS